MQYPDDFPSAEFYYEQKDDGYDGLKYAVFEVRYTFKPIEDKGIHLATIVINRDDVIRYNEKHNCLKRICQKENIIMEVYI